MKTRRVGWLVILPFCLGVLAPAIALAADPSKVLTVIAVKVSGDRQVYYQKIKALQAITKRLGTPAPRVWRASFAGDGADTIIVGTEYASLAALAEAQAKLDADPEWSKLIRELDTSGIRTLIGRSLYVEETPK